MTGWEPQKQREEGGALVGTMIAILVIGTVVLSYISLIASANRDAHRSEAWNGAMAVAEAGLEEALAHLQRNYPSNLLSQGWRLDGTNIIKTNSLPRSYYVVRTSLDPNPVVVSSGFMQFAGEPVYLSRTLEVQTVQTSLVTHAFASKLEVTLNGHNVYADSYDSTDPLYSAPGGLYDPNKAKDGGDIATNLGIEDAFDAGNAIIRGRVSTGPDGTADLGPNAVVGSTSWHSSGNTGAQAGWITDDSNVLMPPIDTPDMSGGFTPGGGTVNGTNYNVILGSDKYVLSKLSGKVLVVGDATLLVTSTINLTGPDFISILPTGSLKLYMAGRTANIGGLGVINQSSQASKFTYYGLPSNAKLAISGNGQFAGVIYAPDTDVTLNGNGDVYGAMITKTLTANGDFQYHFDEALKASRQFTWFKVTRWEER